MKFLKLILSEGRREDFLARFRQKFSNNDLKNIIRLSQDLAPNNKFLLFLGNALNPNDVESQLNKAKELINKFVKYQNVLDQRDINQYKSLEDIQNAISAHENKVRRDVKKLEGADQVYEDDTFSIVTPQTHKASCYYGAGTKWCTASMNGDTHFDRYNQDGKLFYIINKKLPSSDRFYKVALLQKYDGDQTFYDAPDASFKNGWILGTEEWKKMNDIIQNYLNDNFSREIEIFKDKERANKERERIRQQQERERIARRRREQDELRQTDGWNLENNDDEEVEKVNAIFQHLNDTENLDEDTDIYDLMRANHSHYGMDTYEWIPDSSTYAVGTWDEAYEAAKDYVRNLWDDMGMEAFSKSFIESHIDLDELRDYFYEFFYDDISESPESYFDMEDLGLSQQQQERIEKIEEEIAEYEYEMNQLDPDEDEDEIDDFQNLIDALDEEKDDIESNPEGEVTEEMIEETANERADDAKDNYEYYIESFGIDISNYVDEESLIEDVVDSDGIGNSLGTYDGHDYEVDINGTTYYVMRVD
jgi:hypothetical protein